MLQKPYFTGIAGGVESTSKRTVQDLFKRAGNNTGNFLFVSALRNILNSNQAIFKHQADVKFNEEQFDYIAISAANWVNPGVDLSRVCEFIESTTLPCLLVGLGAQVGFGGEMPKLKPGTARFLSVVSERSKSISVRGPHTQEVLQQLGINNTVVTGCPSIIGAIPGYSPPSFKVAAEIPLSEIVLQGTRHDIDPKVFAKDPVTKMNLDIYRLAINNDMPLLLQSELPDMYHAMGRFSNQPILERGKNFLERVYDSNYSEVSQYLLRQGLVFWNIEEWFEQLKSYKFLIGTRIHGVVSGLLSGVPSVLLAHDHRTLELANVINIPCVDMRELSKFDEDTIFNIVNSADFNSLKENFGKYKRNFVDFFEENGVEHIL